MIVIVHCEWNGSDDPRAVSRTKGLLCGRSQNGGVFVRGSGVALSPRRVITSGFLVSGLPRGASLSGVWVIAIASSVVSQTDVSPIQFPAKVARVVEVGDPRVPSMAGSVAFLELERELPPAMFASSPVSTSARKFVCCDSRQPAIGSAVSIRGVPFGLPLFSGSVLRGVVASEALAQAKGGSEGGVDCDGIAGDVFLVDARAPPGTEGALVSSVSANGNGKEGPAVGIVVTSQLLIRGDSYPISLVASLSRGVSCGGDGNCGDAGNAVAAARRSVVLLSSGPRWATGIVVSSIGHIATCAHFVRGLCPSPDGTVSVAVTSTLSKASVPATVIFASDGPWDIALLKVTLPSGVPQFACFVDLSEERAEVPLIGDPAFVVGNHFLGPSISRAVGSLCLRGSLARIVTAPRSGFPVMALVSAPSYDGASGGSVLSSDGRLIGMCTSNLEGAGGRPAVCLAIPTAVLRELFSLGMDAPDVREAERRLMNRLAGEDIEFVRKAWEMDFDFSIRADTQMTPKM